MPRLTAPSILSKPEKTAFRRLAKRLDAAGIEPSTRAEILCDFVQIEGRLAALRQDEATASDGARIAVTRALNVATAERRRLHAELFKGARRIVKPSLDDIEGKERLVECCREWKALLGDAYWAPGLPRV